MRPDLSNSQLYGVHCLCAQARCLESIRSVPRCDKWLILDVGNKGPPRALSIRGVVDSFGPARVLLDAAATPSGPWRRAACFRALGSPLRWQRVELGDSVPQSRYYRLYVRREGHASFRQLLHGVQFHCVLQDS